MSFFNYHMPPFLNVMGFLYILVAAPRLIELLRDGYWRGMVTALIRLLRINWVWLVGGLVLTLLLIRFADLAVTEYLLQLDQKIHSYTFWDFICSCAEGGFVSGVIFSLVMLAEYYRLSYLAAVSRISLMSSIYGGLANGVLKFIFNRQRPSIGLDPWHFFAFFESSNKHFIDLTYAYNSMPSGHTISTLAALTPFFLAYPQPKIRALLIVWALMVNFSRIYTINHWISDVTMASMLGIMIGLASYQLNHWRLKIDKG